MKKITAFFALIMPIFVAAILFICGLATKGGSHKPITSVEIVQDDFELRNETNEDKKGPQLDAIVYPLNAYNTEVYWTSSNPDKIAVDDDGNITAKANAYGTTTITATSKADKTKFDTVNVFVWDDKIHDIDVSNAYNVSYIGLNESKKIDVETIPADRIKNKTLNYEVVKGKDSIITCNADGLITPIAEGEAQVKISAAADPTKSKTIDVKVGMGVNEICSKEKSASLISSSTFDMFDDLVIAPETDKTKLSASDFEYTSDNPDVATFVTTNNTETGVANFAHEGTATFHATYKRNRNLTVTKTVTSTCDYLAEVSWNQQELQVELEANEDGTFKPYTITNLECITYPKASAGQEALLIESSNKDVVEITDDGKYIAKQPGTATLLATIGTGYNQFKYDACIINVLPQDKAKIIAKADIDLDEGIFYYPLRNALSIPTNKNYSSKIEFEIDQTSADAGATLDESGEILNFKNKGWAWVNVYLDGTKIGTIDVNSGVDKADELKVDDSTTTYTIEAGKRYAFSDEYKPVFTDKSYKSLFNYDETTGHFSATCGQCIEEFEITNFDGSITKTVKLIVTEKPVYIKSDINDFVHTSEIEIDFKDFSNCTIVPSTATKADGTPYSLTYEYTPATEDIASVEGDTITYKQSGLVEAKVSCSDTLYEVFKIKSSYGAMTGFEVYDKDSQKVVSNTNVTLNHGESVTYTISDLSSSEASQIEAASLAENSMLDITIEKSGLIRKTLTITITPKADTYGNETIAIRTKTKSFNIYLNIKVTSEIEDIQVYWRTNLLDQENNTCYRSSLTLDVLPYPAVTVGTQYKVTYDGTEKADVWKTNKIQLDNITAGDHTLVFTYTKDGQEITKTFKFTKKDNYEGLIVSIDEAELEDNKLNIYVPSNYRSKSYYLKTNGWVEDDFWTSQASKFTASLEQPTAEVSLSTNCITIKNMPEDDGTAYTNTLTLNYDGKELNKYYLTRDIVSNITFPKHDNNSQADKKGLQKVHVYGKYLFDEKEKIVLDYYKMPIVMYDYNHKEIKDPLKRKDAFDSLKGNININCNYTYIPEEGCVKLVFSKDYLYTNEEIHNNAFDSKTNKNINFSLQTKSKKSNAHYSFVVIDGINVDNENALIYIDQEHKKFHVIGVVLQTNFGLENTEKENVPVLNPIWSEMGYLFGNGYTINLNAQYLKSKGDGASFLFKSFSNVTLQGCYSKNLSLNYPYHIILDDDGTSKNGLYSYSTITNFTTGVACDNRETTDYFKNCLFYNNVEYSIMSNNEKDNVYIENCIFFDSSSLPIVCAKNAKLYLKNNVEVYNFKDEKMLKNLFGTDLTFMWPIVLKAAQDTHMTQKGADGKEYINSFMATGLDDEIYFWDNVSKKYIKQGKGTSSTLPYLAKYIDLKLPWPLSGVNAGLWATYSHDYMGGAPDYYEEYNPDGTLRLDFLNKQIDKVTRRPNYF